MQLINVRKNIEWDEKNNQLKSKIFCSYDGQKDKKNILYDDVSALNVKLWLCRGEQRQREGLNEKKRTES